MLEDALAIRRMKMAMLQSAHKTAMLKSARVERLPLRPQNHPEKQRGSEEQPGDATEHTVYYEDDCDEAFPQCITSNEAAATVADATGKKQMFTKSLAQRDDWLHRGIMLRDMDYYHYARYVERGEMPRSGSAQSFQKRHGLYFLFDAHYPLAKTYVQILLKKAKTVQNVGPQCKRSDVNGGEDKRCV